MTQSSPVTSTGASFGSALAPSTFTHVMEARSVLGFHVRRGATVECLSGELWVTGPGSDDHILSAGQSLTLLGPGRVVVQALVASRLGLLRRA